MTLFCGTTNIEDLSPLQGMKLMILHLGMTKISDLSPLRGMPLKQLTVNLTKVSNLSPLEGMALTSLDCSATKVSDLTPLSNMPLKDLNCDFKPERDTELLRSIKTLETINSKPTAEFWTEVEEQQKGKKLGFQMLGFDQWVKDVQAMPAQQQVGAVSKKLVELNPGFDGKMTGLDSKGTPAVENGVITALSFYSDNVTDISPVRALVGLKRLECASSKAGNSNLTDLSPLKGIALTLLKFNGTKVSDLSPLVGMPLENLNCSWTQVSDLAPLRGLPLTILHCNRTLVSDLAPLLGMELIDFAFTPQNITNGLDVLRQMKSVTVIRITGTQQWPPNEFWKKYEAGGFGAPMPAKPITDINAPAFQQWMKEVAAMPAEKQVDAVSKKLMELNPGFDGKVTERIEDESVTHLGFVADNVTDLSPVRALERLKSLSCCGASKGVNKLSDLSPLDGMKLTSLYCHTTQISDFAPIKNTSITYLHCGGTAISDLSSLSGMRLTTLICSGTNVSDLSALAGMPLIRLSCIGTLVSELSPLETCMSLKSLEVNRTKVTPAVVAALQKALPDCKIEWDDPMKAATSPSQ